MKKNSSKIGAGDIVLLVVSVFFLIGILTFFQACGPKDDGSWMTCHWAGQALTGLAAVLTVIALIVITLVDDKLIGRN